MYVCKLYLFMLQILNYVAILNHIFFIFHVFMLSIFDQLYFFPFIIWICNYISNTHRFVIRNVAFQNSYMGWRTYHSNWYVHIFVPGQIRTEKIGVFLRFAHLDYGCYLWLRGKFISEYFDHTVHVNLTLCYNDVRCFSISFPRLLK